jgi:hypothetical protein
MEKEKILIIGKYEIDISNISVYQKRIARKKWNVLMGYQVDTDGEILRDTEGTALVSEKKPITSTKKATRKIIAIGLFIIRQEFEIIKRRFSFWDSVKEIIKRYLISVRYIESLTENELNIFVEWVTEVITGQKKKSRNFLAEITESLEEMLKGKTKQEVLSFQTYALTSLADILGDWEKLNPIQKATS